MKRLAFLSTLTALAIGAHAQLNGINSTQLITRYYNDVPGSTLTTTNVWPSVTIHDVLDGSNGQGNGFANRHDWALSNDGGASAYQFDGTQSFSLDFDLTLTGDGTPGVEGGVMLDNPGNGNHWYLIKTGNGGEVAAFGGGLPFYSFTASQGVHWTNGTLVHMGIDYSYNGVSGSINYRYNNLSSGFLAWGNVEGKMLAGTRVGGYAMFQNDANSLIDNGDAKFGSIGVVPEPASMIALVAGLAAFARRRRSV